MSIEVAVETEGLYKVYRGSDRPAVENVTVSIPKGRVFGLLGPNGAGKTTLLSMICGLLEPSAGSARVMGHSVAHERAKVKRAIGLVPQELAIYPGLTARENLAYFGHMQGLHGRALHKRVKECIFLAGLEEFSTRRADTFSGGLKRRLNLVIGLISEPAVLVLDEPTVGIDPQSRRFIHDTLRSLSAHGMTIIYTSHYMEEAESLCDELAIIDHGRIISQGSLDDLLRRHRSSVIELHLEQPVSESTQKRIGALSHVRSIATEGKSITLRSDLPQATLRDALDILRAEGLDLASLSMGATNLEKVFMTLTGTRLRD
ncbi:MAG: ABC transporter ATP-binding protein [Acidiferrobacterales bacterium]